MVSRADVRHHRHVAFVEAAALAEDAPAGGLEDGGRHRRIGQHAPGALRAAAIAAVDLPPADPDPLGAGRADGRPADRGDVRQEAHDRRLAVGAGDRGHGDAPLVAGGEERVDDRRPDVARLADGRLQVHAQAGAGVDLDEHAPLRLQRPRDVLGHAVDAGDVEPHHPRRLDGPRGDLGMDQIGHVLGGAAGAEIGAFAQQDHAPRLGHRVGVEPLLAQHRQRHLVEGHRREAAGMVGAAPRILVDLRHQIPHRRGPVAGDHGRMAPRRGDQRPAHDEQAVVVAAAGAFHDDRRFLRPGHRERRLHLLARGEVHTHPAPLVAVARLDDDRHADLLGGRPGVGGVGDRPPLGHGDPRLGQERARELLVLRDRLGDGRGAVGLRGPDAALLGADAEAHQRPVREAARGDAAVLGRPHDGARAGAELHLEEQSPEALDLRGEVEGLVGDRGHDQPVGRAHALHGERLLLVRHDHLVDAGDRCLAGLAEADHDLAGQRLQLDRHVLEDVAHPGAGAQPLEEAAALADGAAVFDHRRQPRHDPLVEARQRVGGKLLQPAEIDDGFEHRDPGPLVGAAQGADRLDLHG